MLAASGISRRADNPDGSTSLALEQGNTRPTEESVQERLLGRIQELEEENRILNLRSESSARYAEEIKSSSLDKLEDTHRFYSKRIKKLTDDAREVICMAFVFGIAMGALFGASLLPTLF